MKVYFDTSALNRIFDDQSQMRIRLEATVMEVIFFLIDMKILEFASSDALVYEAERNPFADRRIFVE